MPRRFTIVTVLVIVLIGVLMVDAYFLLLVPWLNTTNTEQGYRTYIDPHYSFNVHVPVGWTEHIWNATSASGIRAILSVTPSGSEYVYPSFGVAVDRTLASSTLTSYSDTYKAKIVADNESPSVGVTFDRITNTTLCQIEIPGSTIDSTSCDHKLPAFTMDYVIQRTDPDKDCLSKDVVAVDDAGLAYIISYRACGKPGDTTAFNKYLPEFDNFEASFRQRVASSSPAG